MRRWNSSFHREWASQAVHEELMVVSLRAVLRVFPLAMAPIVSGDNRDLAFALQSFRFLFSAWASVVHFQGLRIAISSEKFRYPSESTAAEPAGLAIHQLHRINSLKTVTGARTAAVKAAELVEKAALFQGSTKATLQCWQAIAADIDLLEKSNISRLVGSRLWLIDVLEGEDFKVNFPKWIRRPLDVFDKDPDIPDLWKIWLRWYRAILSDHPTAQSGE